MARYRLVWAIPDSLDAADTVSLGLVCHRSAACWTATDMRLLIDTSCLHCLRIRGILQIMDFLTELDEMWTTNVDRRSFHRDDRIKIYKKHKGHCKYCGKFIPMHKAYIDHVFPYAKGGLTVIKNAALSCSSCNIRKGHNSDKQKKPDGIALFFRRVRQGAEWGDYMIEEWERFRVFNWSNVSGYSR